MRTTGTSSILAIFCFLLNLLFIPPTSSADSPSTDVREGRMGMNATELSSATLITEKSGEGSPEVTAEGMASVEALDDTKTTILFSGFYTRPEEPSQTTTELPEEEIGTTEVAELWKSYHELEQEKYREAVDRDSCKRKCTRGGPKMVCRYHFTVEWYQTMSKACYDCPFNLTDCYRTDCIPADGVQRPVIAVNRTIPGPSIEVCLGDVVIVDVENAMSEDTLSLHWHGQKGSPYMDGVPFVTQCPIQPRTTFRYNYVASSPGTHFWHSHTGNQRGDGMFGAFVVRVPIEVDPQAALYDLDLSEHTVVVLDWSHSPGVSLFTAHHHSDGTNKPPTLQVNGKGLYKSFFVNETQSEIYTPPASFTVAPGLRYRFRLINAGVLNCPIQMSIDNHTMKVISSDGYDLNPVTVDSLVSYAGERWDFVLETNQDVDNYWIRFRGLMDCDHRFTAAHQVAVLRYVGSDSGKIPDGELSYEAAAQLQSDGLVVNALNAALNDSGSLSMSELSVVEEEEDPSLKEQPSRQIVMSFDFHPIDNIHFHKPNLYGYAQINRNSEKLMTPQLNHVSLKLPPFPLLSQQADLRADMLCNQTAVEPDHCTNNYCECTNIVDLKLGEIVELVLIDLGVAYDANHPFHLHGHKFRVIGMDRLGNSTTVEQVLELDRKGLIKRNLKDPPMKDTVTVPDGGYTIIRFWATHPGYWLFHCHLEFHAEIGMAVVFKSGGEKELPPVPAGFPKCGDFLPEPQIEDESDQHGSLLSSSALWPRPSFNLLLWATPLLPFL